jgi:hypothetical protein
MEEKVYNRYFSRKSAIDMGSVSIQVRREKAVNKIEGGFQPMVGVITGHYLRMLINTYIGFMQHEIKFKADMP